MTRFWLADELLVAAKIDERSFMAGKKPGRNVHIIFTLDRLSGWSGESDKWFDLFAEQIEICVSEFPSSLEFVKDCCREYAPEGWFERALISIEKSEAH